MIAAWARARGWSVVDPARALVAFDRARAGQDARTGAACGAPLSRWRATRRWAKELGAQGRVSASVQCDDAKKTCSLSVRASDSFDFDGTTLADLTAPFDARAPWRDALAKSLAAMTKAPDDDGAGGLGMLGGLANGPVQARPERLTFTAWASRASDRDETKDALSFAGSTPLRACFEGGGDAELAIEVSDDGAIARCEPADGETESSTCACAAFTQHATAAPIARGKRLHVSVHYAPADVTTSWNGVVTASTRTYLESYKSRSGEDLWRPDVTDASIAEWKPPSDDRVARCFADVAKPTGARFRARVKFDAVGRAATADVYDPKGLALTDAERACVRSALLLARAPCPASPQTSALVEVSFAARTIGSR